MNIFKTKLRNYNTRKRFFVLLLVVVVMFVAVFGKLAYVMLWQNSELQVKALSQWLRDVPNEAARGQIVDRNGEVLADTSTLYTIYVRPNSVTDKIAVANVLSNVLELDHKKVTEKISKHASEITIANGVTKDQMTLLFSSGLDGIYYGEDNLRYYPYGDFMSQLLGFTSSDGNGQTGLEAYYDRYLEGVDGKILTETDLVGREVTNGTTYYVPSIAGGTLVTTVDTTIQRIVQMAVNKAMTVYNPKNVACVVMNYKTGEIVALAEAPSFDLNNVPRDDIASLFSMSRSTIVSNVYEPGSTFKILTAAIALDTNSVTVDQRFYCAGSQVVDGQKIKCWKTKGHGSITFAEGVEKSCNVVFMNSAMAVGTTNFYKYLRAFGLTEKTGIDMAGETSGILINESSVKVVDLARIGFGQAIAISPIELLCSTSAVVNGGTKVTPRILNYVYDTATSTIIASSQSSKGARIISEQTSATMRELLKAVVTKGSGKGAYVAGYDIIGKTGTAQKYANGIIAQGKYVSSFLGYSLEEGAEYGVLFIVDEPEGYVYYGSLVAAPLVGEIFQGIFNYLDIEPNYTAEDKAIIGDKFELPSFEGMTLNQAKNALTKLGLYFEVSGDGNVVKSQFPVVGAEVDKRNTVLLIT
ncbi:MAG: penicillin-binding transpeptidase domain-containing protein [Clostridia bacterium]|nr:penicillin-binding transpeptidase domain-containing protein [Clostridia bacterium]